MQSDTCADPRYMFNMVGIVHRHFKFPPFCLEGSRGGQFHYMLNVPTEGWHIRIICLFTTCSTFVTPLCCTPSMFHLKQLEPKVFPSHGPTRYRTACESQPGCWRCGVQKFFRFHPTRRATLAMKECIPALQELVFGCCAGSNWNGHQNGKGGNKGAFCKHTTIPGIQLEILASFKTLQVVRHSVARSIKQLMEPKMGQNFFEDMGMLTIRDHRMLSTLSECLISYRSHQI